MTWEEAVIWLRNQPDQQELVKSCFYDDPLFDAAERYYQSSEWKAIQKILTAVKHGNALDIGAGRGISSYSLAKDGWNVCALEPDASDVVGTGAIKSLFAVQNMKIEIVESFAETLHFEDNKFDLIYARAVLHHADNLEKFIQEIHRVLKPGGLFIATREHVISKKSDLQKFWENHPLHKLYDGEYAYLLEEYLNAIKKSGLKIDEILRPFDSDINLFPYSLEILQNKIFILKNGFIFNITLKMMNKFYRVPGRLFSFICSK